MSSSALVMARSPFSTAAFAQLVRRLRHTNARYNQIARQFRHRLRPTHHAQRRAFRAGLRIDTAKARAATQKHPGLLPVLDRACAAPEEGPDQDRDGGGACMRASRLPPLRSLPEVVARKPRRRDGRQRIVLRLPPLRLALGLDDEVRPPFHGPIPGAPRLLPRQLPEEESGVAEMTLGLASSDARACDGALRDVVAAADSHVITVMDGPDSTTPDPLDVRLHSGLCITIPPRGVKRKLQDFEADPNPPPKRVLRDRWNDSQRQ